MIMSGLIWASRSGRKQSAGSTGDDVAAVLQEPDAQAARTLGFDRASGSAASGVSVSGATMTIRSGGAGFNARGVMQHSRQSAEAGAKKPALGGLLSRKWTGQATVGRRRQSRGAASRPAGAATRTAIGDQALAVDQQAARIEHLDEGAKLRCGAGCCLGGAGAPTDYDATGSLNMRR
jgi:hypothetical protein